MFTIPTYISSHHHQQLACQEQLRWLHNSLINFSKNKADILSWQTPINTLRPRQMDAIVQTTFWNAFSWMNVWIPIKISLKFVPKGRINNIPILVQVMAWRRPGDKPLSEPMMVRLPTHICVTRPQWVKFREGSFQVTSHYLSQCWFKSMLTYYVTRLQWVNI